MFQVFISRQFDYYFPDAHLPLPSPLTVEGVTYYRLDALFFAWASRVLTKAHGAGVPEAVHALDWLEDMRIHLAQTDPAALAHAAELLASGKPVKLPTSPATAPLPVVA